VPQRLVTKQKTDQIFRYIEKKSIEEITAPETTTVLSLPPTKAYTTQLIQLETSPATTLGDFQTLTAQNSSQSTSKTNLIYLSSTEKTNYFTTLPKTNTSSNVSITTNKISNFFDLNTTSTAYNESVRLIMTLAALAEFFDENLEEILMVIFAIVSSLLFVVVVILFVHYEKPCCPISETKKRKDEDDRSSLLEITHIEHNINLQQKNKSRLRRSSQWVEMMTSCFHFKQRRSITLTTTDDEEEEGHYRVTSRNSSLLDVVGGEDPTNETSVSVRSPSPLVIVTTENDTTYSAFPVNRFEDDATSLYEYPDQPNSTIVNAQVPVEAHRHKTGPNGITYLQGTASKFQRERTLSTSPQRGDPPPFPQPSKYEQALAQHNLLLKKRQNSYVAMTSSSTLIKYPYHCHHNGNGERTTIVSPPHYATHRTIPALVHNYQSRGNTASGTSIVLSNVPRQGGFPLSYSPKHQTSTFVTMRNPSSGSRLTSNNSGGEEGSGQDNLRPTSIYDNSLPRGSPLYEYYQQQHANELPGTRNLNQYFS